jgi:hypothetical protein
LGHCIGRDTALSIDVPLPHWVTLIQSTSTIPSGGDWTDYSNGEEVGIAVDEDDIPREVNIDTDLVVQLME